MIQEFANNISNHSVCLVGVLALCAYVIVSRFDQLKTGWKSAAGASVLLVVAAMIIGWTVSGVLRMQRADSLALAISFAVRNVGLATAIAITIMNRIEYAVFSTVYFLSEVLLVLGGNRCVPNVGSEPTHREFESW